MGIKEGCYWICINNEWTIGELRDDKRWIFLGNDESYEKLPNNSIIGSEIIPPTACHK
jgi:hypothetical protein